MAVKSSGTQLAFSEIEAEFGQNPNRGLGAYRVSQTVSALSFNGIDSGVPSSGTIRFSDFYSKKLNIVVDCHSGDTEYRINAKTNKWNQNSVTVIGGFRGRKESGSKVFIHVNKTFGCEKNVSNACALRTGSWSGVELRVDVGSDGKIYGAGGDGGPGCAGQSDVSTDCGSGATNNGNGKDGNHALGVEYNGTVVSNSGRIICGFGGGGGGGSARQTDKGADRSASGGGGGGGAGLPAGSGGEAQTGNQGNELIGATTGSGASTPDGGEQAGEGGGGGNNENEAIGGTGGDGGDESNNSPEAGGDGGGRGHRSEGGAAGSNGEAMRRTSGISVTISGGTIVGGTTGTGVE